MDKSKIPARTAVDVRTVDNLTNTQAWGEVDNSNATNTVPTLLNTTEHNEVQFHAHSMDMTGAGMHNSSWWGRVDPDFLAKATELLHGTATRKIADY